MKKESLLNLSNVRTENENETAFELLMSSSEWTLIFNFSKYRENTSFVISNITLKNVNETFVADSSPKFMTALTKRFLCVSSIEIPMGSNASLYMANISLQVFNLEPTGKCLCEV